MKRVALAIVLVFQLFSGDVKELKLRIKILQRDIRKLEIMKGNTAAALERTSSEVKIIQAKVDLEREKVLTLDREIMEKQGRIEDLKGKVLRKRKELLSILKFLYKIGVRGKTEFFLSVSEYSYIFPSYSYLSFLGNTGRKVLSAYKQSLRKKENEENELKKKIAERKEILKKLKREKRNLEWKKEKLSTEMSKIMKNKGMKAKLLKELLEVRIESPENEESSEKIPAFLKGKLFWPLKGKIVRKFGIQIHPVFKTKIKSNGIEIEPYNRKEKVRASASGKISYISRFMGYGRVVIINHGGRYYTIYGHLLDVFVKKGDIVKEGQEIGSLGEGNFWKGRTLYFEVRHGEEPLNPLRWLKNK